MNAPKDKLLEPAVFDEQVALDFDLKATVVTALLNCNPKRCPSLPAFRITELLSSCTASFDSKKSSDFQVVDSLLSLYLLCLHFGQSTFYDSACTVKCIAYFLTWITEAIIVDQHLGCNGFAMADPEALSAGNHDVDTAHKLEIFQNALELARVVLRDTYGLARELRQQRHLRDEAAIPKNPDCAKPTTIYFMLSFALCHLVAVLHSQNNLSVVPGLPEALMVIILSKPAAGADGDGGLIDKAQQLGIFVAHIVFTARTLQEVILVRGKVNRHLLPPEIEFVQYRTANFKAFSNASVGSQRRGGQANNQMDFRLPGFHFLQGTRSVIDVVQQSTAVDSSTRPDPRTARICQQLRALKRAFRPPFLVLQSVTLHINAFEQVFEPRYHLPKYEFPSGNLCNTSAVSTMPASKAAVDLERALYRFSRDFLVPRFLNPKQESYWITLYLTEYFYKRTSEGGGFCPPPDREKIYVQKRLQELDCARIVRSKSLQRSLQDVHTKAALETRLLELDGLIHRECKGKAQTRDSAESDELEAILHGSAKDTTVPQVVIYSVVWFCPPKKNSKSTRLVTMGVESFSDNPLSNLPSKAAAIEYAKQFDEQKHLQSLEETRQQQLLDDQQQEILAKNRARKAATLRSAKERVKEEIDAKNTFKTMWAAQKAKKVAEAEQRMAKEARAKEEAEMQEVLRIRDIKATKIEQQRQAAEDYAMELELEKTFISKIVGDQEAQEIVRRIKEEARMKYLEERRRVLDARLDAKRLEEDGVKQQRQAAAVATANAIQARIRQGNFVWHNGKYGFYDNVRREVKDYVQYEDAQGIAFYYDPIYGTSQYRLPTDALVHHYTDDERRAYDEVHGEGAYDIYKAETFFKDEVNRLGGYYNERREWVTANGYYDENYEWVEYDGFFDDKGKYVRFAKVSGDLTFMV